MSKKVLIGALLGSAATAAAWKLLPSEKKAALKQRVNETATDLADWSTDYALDALDIVDAKLAETESLDRFSGVVDSVKDAKDKAKHTASHLADRLTNDDFDQETADIRRELAAANHPDDNDDRVVDDDIVIDATNDKDEKSTK
ncbi:MAG: hypothetical protein ACI4T4_00870 [Limosilactobacillus sp.]